MGEVLEKFTLPDTKVTVKYIKRKKGMASNVGEDHVISGGMLSGSVKRYCTPLMRNCLLYTSPSPRDRTRSRMPSSA